MIELYSIRDVSRILAVQESRLRYWMQTGFIGPTVRKGGRFYYTFTDLIAIKAAKDLLETGMPLQRVRKNVDALKHALPDDTHPTTKLRVCCDGETIVALADDVAFQPIGGQLVMAFTVPSFGEHVLATLANPRAGAAAAGAAGAVSVPVAIEDGPTEANGGTTAYRHFVEACAAEDRGESETAEHLFRLAVELEPHMAAALTNLGNLVYRRGEMREARAFYERALDHDPGQAEARYNLANLLEDLGETEAAISELRQVCAASPGFADAHYNLGIMLAQVGGTMQAKQCLERYLELDGASDWASHARSYLDQIAA
ncbi:MAG TPA: tetratricopeptide repeat protein [Kofleriaceae bacterium]|jgi:tetratricopeptide (TPR) repeat protein|nr:tetratricopeptide repeat protein [Kofleriaceae bacterium]